jgi:hypothetical protein
LWFATRRNYVWKNPAVIPNNVRDLDQAGSSSRMAGV